MTTHRELAARMIAKGEGLRLKIYDDATGRPIKAGDTLVGHPTIGFGRNISDRGISREEAEAMLAVDVADAEVIAMAFVGRPTWLALDDTRRAVLMDMAHNLGPGRLDGFRKLRAAIQRLDWQAAAAEIEDSAYFRQVKGRGIRNRDAMRTGAWAGAEEWSE